jgi:hypothetical protein
MERTLRRHEVFRQVRVLHDVHSDYIRRRLPGVARDTIRLVTIWPAPNSRRH